MKKHLTSMAGGILFVFLTLQAHSAPFAAPEEGACTLHMDRVPLDVDTMSDLSEDLAIISRSPVVGPPARHRRASAQALALALALDPGNASARSAVFAFSKEKEISRPGQHDLIKAEKRTWQLYDWLSTPEAGMEGKRLAGLMGDSLRYLNPDHPSAVALKDSPENGQWDGWVAELASFQQKASETPS